MAVAELIEKSRAEGYARAVAALRDDERFERWWSAAVAANESVRLWCGPPSRAHLADYLEVVTEGGEPNG